MKSKKLRRSPWSNSAETFGQKVENVSKVPNDPRNAVDSHCEITTNLKQPGLFLELAIQPNSVNGLEMPWSGGDPMVTLIELNKSSAEMGKPARRTISS